MIASAGMPGGTAADEWDGFGLSVSHVWIASTFTIGGAAFGANLSAAGMSNVFIGRAER